jgi:hypothetical protein
MGARIAAPFGRGGLAMTTRIARIVRMGKLGGYAALLGGALLEIDGHMLWPSVEAVIADVQRHGVETSRAMIDTRSVTG